MRSKLSGADVLFGSSASCWSWMSYSSTNLYCMETRSPSSEVTVSLAHYKEIWSYFSHLVQCMVTGPPTLRRIAHCVMETRA